MESLVNYASRRWGAGLLFPARVHFLCSGFKKWSKRWDTGTFGLLLFFFLILCKLKSMILSLFYGDRYEKQPPHFQFVPPLQTQTLWVHQVFREPPPPLVTMVESGLGFGFKSRLWEFLQCWHVTLNSINDLAFQQPFGLVLSPSETSDLIQALCTWSH